MYLFSTNDRWWFNSKFFYLPVVRRATSADQYVFDSLSPGDYFLVALRAEDDVALRLEEAQGHPAPDEMDAAMLRRLAPFAGRITLAERQRATIDIPLSPLP